MTTPINITTTTTPYTTDRYAVARMVVMEVLRTKSQRTAKQKNISPVGMPLPQR